MSIPRFVAVTTMYACLLLLLGCGQPQGTVTGTASYKGKPVTAGSISFVLQNKGIAQDAPLDPTGKYSLSVPMPTGTYLVCYVPPTPEPQDPAKPRRANIATPVPKRYQEIQKSGITVDLTAGSNQFSIEFKD